MAQCRPLLERRIRRGEKLDRVLSDACEKRKSRSSDRSAGQRIQPRKDRRERERTKGRKVARWRFAVAIDVRAATWRGLDAEDGKLGITKITRYDIYVPTGKNARWPHRVRAGLALDACATSVFHRLDAQTL